MVGTCVVKRGDDGLLEILHCDEEVLVSGVMLREMIATHNKFQRIVSAAIVLERECVGDDGDYDEYVSAIDDIIAGVQAL